MSKRDEPSDEIEECLASSSKKLKLVAESGEGDGDDGGDAGDSGGGGDGADEVGPGPTSAKSTEVKVNVEEPKALEILLKKMVKTGDFSKGEQLNRTFKGAMASFIRSLSELTIEVTLTKPVPKEEEEEEEDEVEEEDEEKEVKKKKTKKSKKGSKARKVSKKGVAKAKPKASKKAVAKAVPVPPPPPPPPPKKNSDDDSGEDSADEEEVADDDGGGGDNEKQKDQQQEDQFQGDQPGIVADQQVMHVNDVDAEFWRLAKLGRESVAFEVKGLLLEITLDQVPAFIDFLKRCVLQVEKEGEKEEDSTSSASSDNNPKKDDHHHHQQSLELSLTTLSLAVTDPYRSERLLLSADEEYFQPLLELEALFLRLEHLYLTFNLTQGPAFCNSFFPRWMQSLADRRRHRAGTLPPRLLTLLDINFPINDCHSLVAKSAGAGPLLALVPQLEHLGLQYNEEAEVLKEVLSMAAATGKLRFLKLYTSKFGDLGRAIGEEASARLARGLTSLVVTEDFTLKNRQFLASCTELTWLKVYNGALGHYTKFTGCNFHVLRTIKQLRTLTLVNFDLVDEHDEEGDATSSVLPEVTTLSLVSTMPKLEQFRRETRDPRHNHRYIYAVDVALLARTLNRQFPMLQRLNIIGMVNRHEEVRRRMIERLVEREGKSVQLYFVNNPIKERMALVRSIHMRR